MGKERGQGASPWAPAQLASAVLYETQRSHTVPPETGVIELKLGSRSGADLRDTIQNQLVRKYLQPDRRRAGCLLVTVRDDKAWDHPDTLERLDIRGLRRLLADEATRVESALYGSVRISTRVLDLRPPLGVERLNKRGPKKKISGTRGRA